MAWIEMDDGIWEHHKTIRLCSALNISDVAAVGHLTALWHFVLRNAWRNADLEPWGETGVEKSARWTGKPGVLLAALRECGFIDGFEVHGWLERAGRLVNDRLYNERRKINAVKRRKTPLQRRKTEATLPYLTQPYPTLPNPTSKPKRGEVAFVIPNWIDPTTWSAYLEVRKAKKATSTSHALQLIVKTLDGLRLKGYNPKTVLEKSIMSGWTGVFEPRREYNHSTTLTPEQQDRIDQRKYDEEQARLTNAKP